MPEHDMADHELDHDLAQQLRAYESAIPHEEVPMHARPKHRSRWLLGFGVALAGTAAGVLLAVVLLNRPSAPVGEATPTPSASATTSPSISPTPAESPGATEPPATATVSPSATSSPAAPDGREGWTPVGIGVSGPSAGINGVVAWGNGLMAFGRSETELGGIWLSEDGTSWTAAEVPDSPPDTAVHVSDVVRTETGYIAIGALGHPLGSGPKGSVIWTSPDGHTWTEPPGADVVRDRVLSVLAVSGETILAGGTAIWRSTDGGASWVEILPPSDEAWGLADLAVHDGLFIGTGGVGSGFGGPSETAIWTSEDGTAWDRIDLDGDSATSLAPLPDGRLLAIGEGDNAVMAWVSDDGLAWEPIAIDSPCCITHLAATPTGVVGIGFGPSPGATSVSTVDASTWAGEILDVSLRSLVYSERFGLVGGGADADNTPAVIFGPHPHP